MPSQGTVVAVHGLSRQKRDFDFIAAALAKNGYQVLAVDAPGRGGSSWFKNPESYCIDIYADVFQEFIKKLGLGSVHWIGSSMGGLIALGLTQKGHASLLRSLTLVDITHKPNPEACKRIAGYLQEVLPVWQNVEQQVAFTKAHLPLGEVSEEVWRHFAKHQLIERGKGYTLHFDPKIVRQARAELLEGIDWTTGLEKLTCPLSLVAGEISDLCTRSKIEALARIRPDVHIRICPKAGHIPALSDGATQDFITEFLLSVNA